MLRTLTAASVALGLVACDDPNACSELGASRCADEHTLEVCSSPGEEVEARWTRGACPERTPECLERGASAAECVADAIGSCDFATFEGGCVDERTLDDCEQVGDEGVRRHLRCPDPERCGEVPPHALGEGRPPRARHACYTPRPRDAPPAQVTMLTGEARLDGEPPPPVPFRVLPDQRLELSEGARAVLLVKERASRVSTPGEVDPYALQPESPVPTAEAAALTRALAASGAEAPSPDEPLLAPTPNAGNLIRLVVGEGMPGASATVRRFAWRCDEGACGRTVALRQTAPVERMIWRGMSEREVAYEGPELEAGARYELTLGEHRYRVETMAPLRIGELLESMAGWPVAERLSVVAAVHVARGSRAAAVETIERGLMDRPRDRDLLALRRALRGERGSAGE